MAGTKKTVAQEIAELLKQNAEEKPEGFTGTEWVEAVALLPSDVILLIPFCIYDMVIDDHGVAVMQGQYDQRGFRQDLLEDGSVDPDWEPKTMRRSRFDVLAILAWFPLRREDPEMTLEQVGELITSDNTRDLTHLVYKFWGVDIDTAEKQIEAAEAENEDGEKKAEVEETEDFQS